MFVVRNDTAGVLSSVTVTVTGTPSLVIDDTMSTCSSTPDLVPHDLCTVFVRWTAVAGASGELVVNSAGVISMLAIDGSVSAPGTFANDTSAIDFGVVAVGSSAMVDIVLSNTSLADAQFVPNGVVQAPPFAFENVDCPVQYDEEALMFLAIPANGRCKVRLRFSAGTAGWVTGVAMLAGAPVVLEGYGSRGIHVVKRATDAGAGRLRSVPSGIDCGTDCGDQVGNLIGDVTLFEVPDDRSTFAGWTSSCGTDPACTILEQAPGVVFATFAGPESASATLQIAGSGQGQIVVGTLNPSDGAFVKLTQCVHTCTTYVPAGTSLDLHAVTPSRFDGWTGGCTGGDGDCLLSVGGGATATATFNRDDRELVALLPNIKVPEAITFAPDGDLLVASGNQVTKLGIDGTVRWSSSAVGDVPATNADRAIDLVVTAGGMIYSYGVHSFCCPEDDEGVLTSRSAAGAIIESHHERAPSCRLDVGSSVLTLFPPATLVSAPNGDLGALTGGVVDGNATNMLNVVAPDGSLRFSRDLGLGCANAVAVGGDGVYQALIGDQVSWPTSFHVERYDASGSPLAGSGPFATGGSSVAVDAVGALALRGSGTVGRILLDGTVAFSATTSTGSYRGNAVAYDATGNVLVSGSLEDTTVFGGGHLEQRSPTGDLLWSLDKRAPVATNFYPWFSINDLATDNHGRVAIAGAFTPFSDGSVAWIAVYQMP